MKYKKYDYYKVYTRLGCVLLTHVFNAVVAILYHIARWLNTISSLPRTIPYTALYAHYLFAQYINMYTLYMNYTNKKVRYCSLLSYRICERVKTNNGFFLLVHRNESLILWLWQKFEFVFFSSSFHWIFAGFYTMRMLEPNGTNNNNNSTVLTSANAAGSLNNGGGLIPNAPGGPQMQTTLNGSTATGDRLDASSDSAVSSMGSERVPSLSDSEWGDPGSDSAQEYHHR